MTAWKSLGAAALILCLAPSAYADEPEPPAGGAKPIDADADGDGPRREGEPPPAAEAPRTAPSNEAPPHTSTGGSSDHESRVGTLAAAFLGTRPVPLATADGGGVVLDGDGSATLTITPGEATVPMFGIRRWFTSALALDVGFGLGIGSERFSRYVPNPDPTKDREDSGSSAVRTHVAAHLGVPVALTSGAHHTIMVIPELDVAYGRVTLPGYQVSTTGAPLDLQLTGFGVTGGARLAAELAFGFWGVPQLSLQTSWGLGVQYRKHGGRIGDAEHAISNVGFGTSTAGDPWQALSGAFALFYGF